MKYMAGATGLLKLHGICTATQNSLLALERVLAPYTSVCAPACPPELPPTLVPSAALSMLRFGPSRARCRLNEIDAMHARSAAGGGCTMTPALEFAAIGPIEHGASSATIAALGCAAAVALPHIAVHVAQRFDGACDEVVTAEIALCPKMRSQPTASACINNMHTVYGTVASDYRRPYRCHFGVHQVGSGPVRLFRVPRRKCVTW